MVHWKHTGEIEWDIDQNDKTSLLKHFLIVALKKKKKKKKLKTFYLFSRLFQFRKVSRPFQEFKTLYEPQEFERFKSNIKGSSYSLYETRYLLHFGLRARLTDSEIHI